LYGSPGGDGPRGDSRPSGLFRDMYFLIEGWNCENESLLRHGLIDLIRCANGLNSLL
jgi:hypothetical protein